MMNRILAHRSIFIGTALILFLLALTGCAGRMPKPPEQPPATADGAAEARQAQDLFLAGKMAETREDWGDAAIAYIEALQFDPGSDELAFALARVLIRDGKFRSAYLYAVMATELNDAVPEYWQIVQYLNEREGRYGEAANALRRYMELVDETTYLHTVKLSQYYFLMDKAEQARDLLVDEASSPGAFSSDIREIAQILAINGFEDDALKVLSEQIGREPLDVATWLALGSLYEDLGDSESARATYNRALEVIPNNLYLIVAIGNHCLSENDWSCAIEYFERASMAARDELRDAGVTRDDILKTLTAVYFYAGREDDAQALFQSLQDDGLDDAHLYFSLGKAMTVLERYEEAVDHYRTGFAMDLDDMPEEFIIRAFSAYAVALIHVDAVDEALELIRDRASTYINDTVTRKSLEASLYMELERYTDAISIYEWLMASDPDQLGYKYTLSYAYDLNGQFDQAEQMLLDVLDITPDDPLALNNLAYMYLEHETNLEQALTMVEQALINDPQNGAYLDTLAWAYYKLGKYRDAEKHIERALKWAGEEDIGVIWEHYGDIMLMRGNPEEARTGYQNAIESGEDRDRIDEKLKAIDQ